ncbi:MAG: hypothetical protein EP344_07865 [Bacteroidetes bacterium]|nr:MAG: hypothetical protein EP344_07865 [Bacteroidota bacterium]
MRPLITIVITLGIGCLFAQKPQLVVPAGHTGEVTAVAVSPDGKYILTGSGDNTAKLWDLDGREIQSFTAHEFVVSAVAFSPDGQSVLTGSYDGTARLWNLSGGKPKIFKGHTNYVTAVAFSPDGQSILTGSYDGTAVLWSLSGSVRQTFNLTSRVLAVAFSPKGDLVLTGEDNGLVKCWQLNGNTEQVFKHTGAVKSVAFSPDGRFVLTGCLDGKVKVWNLSGSTEQTLKRLGAIHAVAYSPAGQYFVTGCFDDGVAEVRTVSGQVQKTYKGHEFGINAAVFTPDGKYVLTGSADGTARLWDLNGKTVQVFDKHSSEITAIACSTDGHFLLSGSTNGTIKLADLTGFTLKSFPGHREEISSMVFSPDNKTFLSGSYDGKVKLWDLSGTEITTLGGHKGQVNAVAFSPDQQFVLSGSYDQTALIRPLNGVDSIVRLEHPDAVTAVTWSADGKFVLTGCADGGVRTWTASGVQESAFSAASQIKALALAPHDSIVATGAYNGLVQLWDRTGQLIQTFGRPGSEVLSVAFSPDGQYVLAGYADKTARLWSISDGRLARKLSEHSSEVTAVMYLPGGKSAVTAGKDGVIKFWEPLSGKEQVSLIPIDAEDWAAMTPAGLFNASEGAMKIMYYVDNREVVALEQLKERYFEPYLLQKALGLAEGGLRTVDGLTKLPLYPKVVSAEIINDSLRVQLEKRAGGMGKVALLLDDKIELSADINPDGEIALSLDLNTFASHFIPDTRNRLSLRTYNTAGSLKSQPYWLDYTPSEVRERGSSNRVSMRSRNDVALETINLYALVVGTATYRGEQLNLKFPDKDASAFAEALQTTGSKLFGENVEIKLLTTSTETWPRKAEIAAALKDFAAKADPNDILLVYLSGHGITYPPNSEKGRFHYLTTDILSDKLDDPSVLETQAIAQDTLQEWIREVAARKRILILDACNSGRVVETLGPGEKALNSDQRRALERMKDRSGMFVLAGSAADKSSYEASRFGHGLLTYSLLNNMPLVAANNDKLIEVGELFSNVLEQVPRLAKDIGKVQEPELIGSGSWAIGIIDGAPPYPIPQAIPVFLRTMFLDVNRNRDLKQVTEAVDQALKELAAVKQPAIAFWDVAEFGGDHYFLGGKYSVEGASIKGDATLYRVDEVVQTFNFGPAESVEALADEIIGKVLASLSQTTQN